jgi:putative membrane protein
MKALRWNIIGFLFLLAPASGCFYGDLPGGHGWPMMNYWHGGGIMWILILILIGVVIYFVVQSSRSKGTGGSPPETPLDILKKRYARGEITKEEFDKMKQDLEA